MDTNMTFRMDSEVKAQMFRHLCSAWYDNIYCIQHLCKRFCAGERGCRFP